MYSHSLLFFFSLTALASVSTATDIAGGWTDWSQLAQSCSETCGGGTILRIRTCQNPFPEGAGAKCVTDDGDEVLTETKLFECNTQECWAETSAAAWSDWSDCNVNCSIGVRKKFAMCGNETCIGLQQQVMEEECNTWNINTCPSPCEDKDCPKYGVCKDESTNEKPIATCVCTMGYQLKDEQCIRPPPTKPTERPIPTLAAAQKTVATVMSKSASTVLIACVSITLAFFLLMRTFTDDRIIQMNMEIALVVAHLFLLFPSSTADNEVMCKIVSLLLHFFFTAVFMFLLLESLHMYSMVANIVKKGGMFTKVQNMALGWGVSAFIVLFTMCFEYEHYGGKYHCWVQLNKGVSMAEQVPICVMMIITFTLIEAAGAADNQKLEDTDENDLTSALFSQRTCLIILPLVYAHWILGVLSEYQQNLALYSIFSLMSSILGVAVMLLHCSNNQMVRDRLMAAFNKCRGKNKTK